MLMTNTTRSTIDTDADRAIGLMLQASALNGTQNASLSGKILGIVGKGSLSDAVTQRAELGFGMRVISCDPADRTTLPLSALLGEADVVFLNVPDTHHNRALIHALRLNQMKPDALLVALRVGYQIDMLALSHALWFETIGGAAFDTDGLFSDDCARLSMCDNVVLSSVTDDVKSQTSSITTLVPSVSSKSCARAA